MTNANNPHSTNSARHPRRTGVWVGGVVAFMLLLLVVTYLTMNPNPLHGEEAINSAASQLQTQKQSQPIAPADGCTAEEVKQPDCDVSTTLNNLDSFWSTYLPQQGFRYSQPKVIFFENNIVTDCGTIHSTSGTFYCQLNETLYYDTSFFKELHENSDQDNTDAIKYAVSQNFGHHVQNLTGDFEHAAKDKDGTNQEISRSGPKRLELQADCFVGLWERSKEKQRPTSSGGTEGTKTASAAEAERALSSLETLSSQRQGDTQQINIWEKIQSPPEQRAYWYMVGYGEDDFSRCNTFKTKKL